MNWKNKINNKYTQVSIYVIITALIIYSLSLMIKDLPAVIDFMSSKLNAVISVTKPIIIGFAFAYIIEPVVNFFEIKCIRLKSKKGFKKIVTPRLWAAITAILLLLAVMTGMVSILVSAVTNQVKLATVSDFYNLIQQIINSFTSFLETIQSKLGDWDIQTINPDEYVKNAAGHIATGFSGFAISTLNSIKNVSGYFTTIIFSLIIGFYFIVDGEMFIMNIKKVCRALFSKKINQIIKGAVQDLDKVFSGYIRGQLADAFIMMILISLVLTLTGVKFAIVIGMLAGIGNLIPYFGPIVAYISTSLVCLMNGDIKVWIISMIALFVIQFVDGNVIGPKLLSQSINIHPLIVIISLIIGSALGGFMGMLLAVPVGAYLVLVFTRFINRRLEEKKEIK